MLIVAEAGPETAESIGGADDYRIAEFRCCGAGLFKSLCRMGLYGLDIYLVKFLNEKFSVLGIDYGLYRCAEHPDIVLLKYSRAVQGHPAVECRLASECQQNTLWCLFLYDFLHKVWSHGEEIYLVGHPFRSLDCRDIRVDKHSLYAFFLERLESLRTGIVKLSGLPYLKGTGPEYHHFLYIVVYHLCLVFD